MEIVEYSKYFEEQWDFFILNNSINGTFLQTRRFLSYHPTKRFEDASLMIVDKQKIVAVVPACKIQMEFGYSFSSHKGSTYGGIIFCINYYKTEKVIEIITMLEKYLFEKKYTQIDYKITPDILSQVSSELLQFGLKYQGYNEVMELNTYIDLTKYKEDILSNFEQGKRTNIHNCIKAGLECRQLETYDELSQFYLLLCDTLSKYDLKPVHSLEELIDFKESRLKEEIAFYGAFLDNELVAGSMLFYFTKASCIHTQYLASKRGYEKLSPMTYMYYSTINLAKEQKYRYITWGISTEHGGQEINYGLTKSKEAYGSLHSVNRIFSKKLGDNYGY